MPAFTDRRRARRALFGLIAAAAVVLAASSPAEASPNVKARDSVGTDGDVLALDAVGDRVWMGGRFTNAGVHTGAGAVFDEDAGTRIQNLARVRTGTVRVAVKDLKGGWLIGGDFTDVASFSRRGLARILPTGFLSSWNPDVVGTVRAIAYAGGNVVYIGGTFSSVGGHARQNLAAVALDTGAVLPWSPSADGSVDALTIAGSSVYAGGSFSAVGGASRRSLAAIAADTAQVLPWDPGTDGTVEDLLVVGSTVYIGGAFSTLAGAVRNSAGAVESTGALSSWAPAVDGAVRALAVRDNASSIFIGGAFTAVDGQPRANLAEVTRTGATLTAFAPVTNGAVHDLDLSRWRSSAEPADAVLYVAGAFNRVGTAVRSRAAAFVTATGALRPWNPATDADAYVVARSGTGIYLGGSFLRVNSAPRSRVAAMDARTGSLDHGFVADVDGEVKAVAASADGAVVYVGGDFRNANGVPRRNIAAFDGATGAVLPFDPASDAPIRTLAVSSSLVYAGGGFTVIGGQTRPSLAAIRRSDGRLEPAFDAAASGVDVVALSTDESKLYVGGSFQRMGRQPRPGFAEVSALTGLATSFAPTVGGGLVTMTVASTGGRVWMSTHSNRLYAYDPSLSNAPVWQLQTSGDIQGMAASATELYVGGHFSSIKGQGSRLHAASLGTSDGKLTAWNPIVAGSYGVWAVVMTPSGVVMGGDFEKVGNEFHPGLALFHGAA